MVVNSDVFKRVKAKVGKRAPTKANDTNTDFKAAGLHVVQQESLTASLSQHDTTTTERGLRWDQLTNQLQHPASAVRKSAVKGLENYYQQRHRGSSEQSQQHPPLDVIEFLSTVAPAALVDSDSQVRLEGFNLLKNVVGQVENPVISLRPFFGILVSLIGSSLNSLDAKQSQHGARVVQWIATSDLIGNLEETLVLKKILPSLSRLLGRPTGNKQLLTTTAPAATTSTKSKRKKRKRHQTNDSKIADIFVSCPRYEVLCAVEALLRAVSKSNSPPTTNNTAQFPLLTTTAASEPLAKRPRLLRSINDFSSQEKDGDATLEHQAMLDDVCCKLRDLLLEADYGDDQFVRAAACLRMMSCFNEQPTKQCCSVFSSVVRYLSSSSSSNNNGLDGTILFTIWRLSRHLTDCDKWDTWLKKEVLEELHESDVDETILEVLEPMLLSTNGCPDKDRAELCMAFWNRFFAVSPDSGHHSPLDWSTPFHQQVAGICFRLLASHQAESDESIRMIYMQLPDMLLAWEAKVPQLTMDCLVLMQNWIARNGVIENWRQSLDPLFGMGLFEQWPESIQRQLVCLVTRLASPNEEMIRRWSSLIASDHPMSEWMAQCMHAMRKSIPMSHYLGFIIDSTGVMDDKGSGDERLEKEQWDRLDRHTRRACWALLNCGSVKGVLGRLEPMLGMMLEKKGSPSRVAMSVLALFSLDLQQRKLPSSFADMGLSNSFQSALSENIQQLDLSKTEDIWLRPALSLLEAQPSLRDDVSQSVGES